MHAFPIELGTHGMGSGYSISGSGSGGNARSVSHSPHTAGEAAASKDAGVATLACSGNERVVCLSEWCA